MSGYEAFVLSEDSRRTLKQVFPPAFPTWIGHHITHKFPAQRTPNVPYGEQTIGDFEVIGRAVGEGIEALVVTVRGKSVRPDGGTYHITWSLDRDLSRKPFHSNALIKEHGFVPCDSVRFSATFDFVNQ